MFNLKKKCDCGFERKYDDKNDVYHIGEYIYCPTCGKKLQEYGYSPNI